MKQPLPGMAKFISASGNHVKKPFEQENYSKENGNKILVFIKINESSSYNDFLYIGFSTNDILGESKNHLRVIGRRGRTLRIHGVWLSLAHIENQLVSIKINLIL